MTLETTTVVWYLLRRAGGFAISKFKILYIGRPVSISTKAPKPQMIDPRYVGSPKRSVKKFPSILFGPESFTACTKHEACRTCCINFKLSFRTLRPYSATICQTRAHTSNHPQTRKKRVRAQITGPYFRPMIPWPYTISCYYPSPGTWTINPVEGPKLGTQTVSLL